MSEEELIELKNGVKIIEGGANGVWIKNPDTGKEKHLSPTGLEELVENEQVY